MTSASPPRGPRCPPPRPVEVLSTQRISPRLASIVLGGDALVGFREPAPTAHIKLFLPSEDGQLAVPVVGPEGLIWPDGRPSMRTFTPRRYDAAARTLEVQFALHGEGLASRWAETAVPGDRAAIGGPGGGLAVDPEARSWLIAADESARPAAAVLVEALSPQASVEVHLEVEDEQEHLLDFDHPGMKVVWHDRSTGAGLVEGVLGARLEPQTQVWVAAEASAVRRIRAQLLVDRGHPRAQVTVRGYWRIGQADHTDHDFGDD